MTTAVADVLTDLFLTLNRNNYRPIPALGTSVAKVLQARVLY